MMKMMTTLLMMLAIVAKMTDEEEKCRRKYDDTPKEQEKSEAKDFPNIFGFGYLQTRRFMPVFLIWCLNINIDIC